jgi:CHAT domain-containing protein
VQLALLPTSRALSFCRATRHLPPPAGRPSATATAADSQARLAQMRTRELIVIDPTETLTYAPLEGAAAAVEASRRFQVEILAGQGARRDLVRTAAARVGYLHLIGHGVFDDSNPYRSGMYLDVAQSPESLLTIAEVLAELEAPAGRLAVLSGCETGLRRPNPVSEEISMPAAFLAAGYATVVASRWAVNDLSTSLLVTEFFRRWLAGGIGVGAALGEASRWLRDLPRPAAIAYVEHLAARVGEVPTPVSVRAEQVAREAAKRLAGAPERPFDHPLYWAAFHVLGDPAVTAPEAPAPADQILD